MSRPERLAWFAHRSPATGHRHLGVYDPERSGFFDHGPVDEVAALADGRLTDASWLRGADARLEDAPEFAVPVARPSKILCLGKNYAAHAAEFGAEVPEEPIFFTKFADTMIPHGAPIRLPYWVTERIDHELELGVILGFPDPDQQGRKYVEPAAAMDLVAGYTILNDVTARRMQGEDRDQKFPWLRSKSFDSFCPIGPWVIPRDQLPEVHELDIRLHVNDTKRQESNTRLMVTDIPDAIAYLSRHTTLRPGDVLATGTPEGVGRIDAGDTVTCFVEHIGTLQNPVEREPTPS